MSSLARSFVRSSFCQRRNFVSTVLLSTRYEDRSVAELRQEARKRGLAVSGTKTSLITRIQQADSRLVESLASEPTPPQSRSISSTPSTRAAEVTPSPTYPTLLSQLPDISQSPPELPVQIPFVPDFWESSKVKEKEQAKAPAEPDIPRIVVTAGAATHHAGGPTHHLIEIEGISHGPPFMTPPAPEVKGEGSVLGDILEDLGLPTSISSTSAELKKVAEQAAAHYTTTSEYSSSEKSYSRPLDREEKRGVWLLIGIFAGSWFVGGVANK